MQIDHVVVAAADLEAAARELERRHGLASVDGGRHPGWGTANRIIPLGEAYLELIAVVDQVEAGASPFGPWVSAATPNRPLGWAVRTGDLDRVAASRGLPVQPGSRRAPGGELLRWRTAGIEVAVTDPSLPFFIEWHPETRHPGHTAGPTASLVCLVLRGDRDRLDAWLGPHSLPIDVRPGSPAVTHIVLSLAGAEVVLGTV